MSLYTVEHYAETPIEYLAEAAAVMWNWGEFPSKHFSTFNEYYSRVYEDSSGLPCAVAIRDGRFCGGITYTPLVTDSHMPGVGRMILNVVAHPFELGATQAMFNSVLSRSREEGAAWVQTTRRVSELEFKTKYTRLKRR